MQKLKRDASTEEIIEANNIITRNLNITMNTLQIVTESQEKRITALEDRMLKLLGDNFSV